MRKPVSVEVQDRRRPPTCPAFPRTTPHPPPTLSTSLGRASPLHWSTTSSREGGRELGGVLWGVREALFIAQGGRFLPKLNMETLGTAFRRIRMIFPPKLGPFGANMGPGDPGVQPVPGCRLSHRLSSETLLCGPPSFVCRCRGFIYRFALFCGPSL